MGLLTFSINVTLEGCVDHQEGIADETHASFTRLMDEAGATLWGRVTYEMMEGHWPAVARGDAEAAPAMGAWAVKFVHPRMAGRPCTRTGCPARDGSSWFRRSRSVAAWSPCTTGARAKLRAAPSLSTLLSGGEAEEEACRPALSKCTGRPATRRAGRFPRGAL